jgi:hypothetical protein
MQILDRHRVKELKQKHLKNELFVSKTGRMNLSIPDTDKYLEMIEDWDLEDSFHLLDVISTPFEPAANAAATGNVKALQLLFKHQLAPLDVVLPAAVAYELGLINCFTFSDYDYINSFKTGGKMVVGQQKGTPGIVQKVLDYAISTLPCKVRVLLMLSELEEYDKLTVLDLCSQQAAESKTAARILKQLLSALGDERTNLAIAQCTNAFTNAMDQAIVAEEYGESSRLLVMETWIVNAADVLGIANEDLPLLLSLVKSGHARAVRRILFKHDPQDDIWYFLEKSSALPKRQASVDKDSAITER